MNGPGRDTWADGIQRVGDEAAGVLALQVVQHADVPALIADAIAGDRDATRLLRLVNRALAGIQSAPRSRPHLCAACPRPLRKGRYAIVAVFPARDDATHGLGLGICTHCGTAHDVIHDKAVLALRRIWPDGRAFTISHPEGGHA